MGARTGAEYLEGLRGDGREVWLGGERVREVTEHPAFAGSLRGMAGFYDWQHRHAGECIIASGGSAGAGDGAGTSAGTSAGEHEGDGERGERGGGEDAPVGISHLVPRGRDDLQRRHVGLERLARYGVGMLGRTPDYLNVTFAGFAGQPTVWSANGNEEGAENLIAYQREIAARDLALTHTLIHPVVDARVEPFEGVNRETAVRKVAETSDGIVVRGSRLLGTLGPFADELALYPSRPLPADAREIALIFSIPVATPGVKIVCRDHYGVDTDPFDQPFSSRFDEQDVFIVFDDVEVPAHRVFLDGDPEVYNSVNAWGWHGNIMQQTSIRATVKLEFAYELCCRMAEVTGQGRRPEVTKMLGEVWSYAELTRAAVRAAEADAHEFGDGTWFCDERPFRALRPTLPVWMPRVNEIIRTIGSHNLLATPSKAGLDHPELRPWLDRYLAGAGGTGAVERSRLFRTAWDFVGSALGGRTELYERSYLASAARTYALAHAAAQREREWNLVPGFWAHLDASA